MKTRTYLYVAGCTGSNSPQTHRVGKSDDGGTTIITKPIDRTIFGTHTTSLALVDGDIGYLIDNGSGVGQAAEFLRAKNVTEVYILQTHYHLDHTSGMPQNSLLFSTGIVKAICGPRLGEVTFTTAMNGMFAPWSWPVSPSMFKIEHPMITFTPGDTLPVGKGIRTMLLNHPGGSVAYRIPTAHGDVVIATDNELSGRESLLNIREFIAGSVLMYIDIQYRDGEYIGELPIGSGNTKMIRKNWGHSTPLMLRSLLTVSALPPETIVIGHHDPKRTDEDLMAFEREVAEDFRKNSSVVPLFARECAIYDLAA